MTTCDLFIAFTRGKSRLAAFIFLSTTAILIFHLSEAGRGGNAAEQRVTAAGIIQQINVDKGILTLRVKVDEVLGGGLLVKSRREGLITVSFNKETKFLSEVGKELTRGAAELRGGSEERDKGGASVVVVTGQMVEERLKAEQIVLRTACDVHVCPRPINNHGNCGATTCTCPGH